jgi:uncharacterized protein (DUF1330 family)
VEKDRQEAKMAKGYWIVNVDVHDMEGYKPYQAGMVPLYAKYGARLIIRAGRHEQVEGNKARSRTVVIEFSNYESALECYRSQEYQANRKHRLPVSNADILIIEGFDPPK